LETTYQLQVKTQNYSSFNASVNNIKNTDQYRTILFSSFVKKFNKCNKSADRSIIITDAAVYKLDGTKNKFKNMKRTVQIKEISSISVSPGRDQLVVFHSNHNNDLIINLQSEHTQLKEDRIGEIIGHVCKKYFDFTGRDLPVNVSAAIPVNLGGKPRKVSIEAVAGVENVGFKHAGQIIVFEVPSSYSSLI